jgi:lysozyme
VSAKAVALGLIKQFEGCKLRAYRCPAGRWTCGWGTTGPDVVEGTVWTQAQADARLAQDVEKFLSGVRAAVKVKASDNEIGALTSFAYNVGLEAFRNSTLLRLLNAGDRKDAADQFLRWNKAGGKVLPGLVRRREAERAVFLRAA